MNCPNCCKSLPDDNVFCFYCGSCVVPERFSNSKAVAEKEKALKKIISAVNGTEHQRIDWNSTADRYVNVMEKFNTLSKNSADTEQNQRIQKKISSFIDRCQSPEFHIAFVGTIKAGKSTLINALLGRNLASTSVTPETAVLTKFRYSENSYVKIKFYNTEQWSQLWKSVTKSNAELFMKEYNALNGNSVKDQWVGHGEITKTVSDAELESEIEIWTSSKHVEHYFVREVEIGLPQFPYEQKNVVFVDTPGLNDAVAYRSNVTREYIDRANAVFTCVKSDSLTGPELDTIYRVFANTSYNTDKVFIIGTQWDSLNNPAEDWKKQKAEWVKYLVRESCYKSEQAAQRNIIHAAAYMMNLCREYDKLSRDELKSIGSIGFKFDIMPNELNENLDKLMEKSNIQAIHGKIEHEIIGKTQEYLMSDITENYKDICGEIRKYFSEIRATQKDILETSEQQADVINARYEEEKDKLEKIREHQQQLVDTLDIVRDDTNRRVAELCKELKDMVK